MQTTVENWKAKEAARKSAASALQATHPHLVPSGAKFDSLQAAAKNIRLELKSAFPGIVFSVKSRRFSGGDAIDIRWTDGPVTAQVEAIANRYRAGTFDGMTDSYEYDHNAWRDAFGAAQYIRLGRYDSPHAIASSIRTVFSRYAGNLRDIAIPTAAEYEHGFLSNVIVLGLGDSLSALIRRTAKQRTWCLTKVAPAPEVR